MRPTLERTIPHKISVIIPAHDEATVIDACLESLEAQQGDVVLDVIVVANGCEDGTAAAVERWQPRFCGQKSLRLIELDEPNKISALNAGDANAKFANRAYVDADVVLAPTALCEVGKILDTEAVRVSAPVREVAQPRTFVTRCYARVWQLLPYFNDGVIGCGFYAVNAAGRRRWGRFPGIVADDKFVRLQFAPDERVIAQKSTFGVRLPEGLRELVSIRTRWTAGNIELKALYPELHVGEDRAYLASGLLLAKRPTLWLAGAVFVLVFVLAQARASWRWRRSAEVWERAESIRSTSSIPTP